MKRLGDDHSVDVGVRHRDRLGPTLSRVHVRHVRPENRKHLGRRLDSDDLVPGGDERGGQLACSGAEIEHAAGRIAHQPLDRLSWIARA